MRDYIKDFVEGKTYYYFDRPIKILRVYEQFLRAKVESEGKVFFVDSTAITLEPNSLKRQY